MGDRAIANRYAEALIDLATEAGDVDGHLQDLIKVQEAFAANGGVLGSAMCSPVFTARERTGVLDAVLPRMGLRPLVNHTLRVMNDRNRFGLLTHLIDGYTAFAEARAGVVRVAVSSAEPLSPQLEAEVRTLMERISGKKVLLSTKVDPSLLGGIVARIGSKVYDASLRTRLSDLKTRLKAAPTIAQA